MIICSKPVMHKLNCTCCRRMQMSEHAGVFLHSKEPLSAYRKECKLGYADYRKKRKGTLLLTKLNLLGVAAAARKAEPVL